MVEYNDVEVPLKYESDGDFKEMMQEWWLAVRQFDDDETTTDDESLDGLYRDYGQYEDDGSDSEGSTVDWSHVRKNAGMIEALKEEEEEWVLASQ